MSSSVASPEAPVSQAKTTIAVVVEIAGKYFRASPAGDSQSFTLRPVSGTIDVAVKADLQAFLDQERGAPDYWKLFGPIGFDLCTETFMQLSTLTYLRFEDGAWGYKESGAVPTRNVGVVFGRFPVQD